jgi:prolyl oligopeptidase
LIEDKLVGTFSWGEKQTLRVFSLDGKLEQKTDLPGCCSVVSVSANAENKNLLDVAFQSPVRKYEIVQFDLTTQRFAKDVESLMMTDGAGNRFVTQYIHAKSNGGANVPVRVVHREGIKLDGNNSVMMEGYGGFGIGGNFNPRFNPIHKELLDRGGIYAAPALRGGPEFGKAWATGSTTPNKQNTFNDFIVATEALIKNGYTQPGRVGAMGWSNGGLMMGALATQRPDLFGVLVPGAGVQDMLRKERLDPKYDDGWTFEYGSSDNVSLWENLSKFTPVRPDLRKTFYPTVLIVAGNNDSRVNPIHSYKLAAELQRVQLSKKPIMLVNTKNAGHWMSSEDLQDLIGWRTNVRIWSTIFQELGIQAPRP